LRHRPCPAGNAARVRASFRDWCAENGVSRDLAETALAHAIKDKTEAAYNRTSMIEKRREVMERLAGLPMPSSTSQLRKSR
jgi:integrase